MTTRAHALCSLAAAALLVAALLGGPASAAHALEVPPLTARVNDYARVLSAERASALEAKLAAYEQSTGHQFALLTVDSLKGDAIESFSIRVAEQWKLGDAKRDEGLLLIVVPGDRKLRIEIGYGLEGSVPDAIAARVVREILTPAFQRGEYAAGIEMAFDALMRAASGQAPPEGAPATEPRAVATRSPLTLLGPILLILFMLLMGGGGRRGRRRGGMMWLGPLIGAGMGNLGGGRRGGGGGGGFRGGGGGFGGGGASGGW